MTHRHLFVMDPINAINPLSDSTYDIMLECQARGHEVWECQIEELIVDRGVGRANARRVRLTEVSSAQNHFEHLDRGRKAFTEFNFVWMRKDPPVDNNFVAALLILGSAKNASTKVINDPVGLLLANEKMWPLVVAPNLMPRTIVSSNRQVLFDEAQSIGKVVLKPLFLAGGAGVMVFERNDRNLKSAIDILTLEGKSPAMLQQFIEGAEKGDKRIILVGGKPVGAVLRVPGAEDHRANLHVGGIASQTDISEADQRICAQLEPLLLANGLHFVGIDVINGLLTEVNVTSPTGLQEIDRLNQHKGSDRLRSKLVDYVLSIY